MGIGKRIKEARNARGLTQDELAKALGITKGAVANYENETSHPKEPILYKMFEVLNVDANFLFQDVMRVSPHNDKATPDEFEQIIKRYRTLDVHGKRAVNTILTLEYERCAASSAADQVQRKAKEECDKYKAELEAAEKKRALSGA